MQTTEKQSWAQRNREAFNKRRNAWLRQDRQLNPEKYRGVERIKFANERAAQFGRPGKLEAAAWEIITAFYGNRCGMCGSTDRLCLDHVIPLADPRCRNEIGNIGVLCFDCNTVRKGNQHIEYRSEILDQTEYVRLKRSR
jgi:hypothetical protein